MNSEDKPLDRIVYELRERAKELNCLYRVQELLNTSGISVDQVCKGIIEAIPPGWQYPDICQAQITLEGKVFETEGFQGSQWGLHQNIEVQDKTVGRISVYYTEERPDENGGPFLKEERKLINSIADQLGMFLLHEQLKTVFAVQQQSAERKEDWWVILDLLRRTDPSLLVRISRKMVNLLIWKGVNEANDLLENFSPAYRNSYEILDVNEPSRFSSNTDQIVVLDTIFELASNHISQDDILENIQSWIREDQSNFLVHVLVHPGTSLDEIDTALERYHHLKTNGLEITGPRKTSAQTALARRLLSDDPNFINKAKEFIPIDEYYNLMQKMIFSSGSHGTAGGKSAGVILAHKIIERAAESNTLLKEIKIPKTWIITSDSLFDFLSYNGIEDVIEHKYRSLEQIRHEYPYIVHIFKNASLPPDVLKNLQIALDDFGETPLIVRSSSLLEDRTGLAFAGKYKSLFIANTGTKEERMHALEDAITEVYASMFSPDPIEYRLEHSMIDQHEEMGILIQEVVGTNVGPYRLPLFAGVAFSSNQFPWSSRIKPDDGLVRLVPGLGTRAVDRLGDDYPVMVSPGQPGLRIHQSPDEVIRYSPKQADVINIQDGEYATIDLVDLYKNHGKEIPGIERLVSRVSEGYIQHPVSSNLDFEKDTLITTCENLISRTSFLNQIYTILSVLESNLGYPVDIEFAHDGKELYLLQCRSQNFPPAIQPAEIPAGIAEKRVIFSTNRFVSNAMIKDISHIVYIDPEKYDQLSDRNDLLEIGRIVGRLNKLLPRKKFILIGPGRWGSRGDLKLGVRVSFADIRNSAMLVELAFPSVSTNYEPSFGTHFFQDLVEASIRFLPLDTSKSDNVFNRAFFNSAANTLLDLLPKEEKLAEVIKVIDIDRSSDWKVLDIYMNSAEQMAVAFLNG